MSKNKNAVQCCASATLYPEQGRFRVGEVAEARSRRAAEKFGLGVVEIASRETVDRAVRVDDHERQSARREMAPERPGKPNDVRNVAAVDEQRARNDAPDEARP